MNLARTRTGLLLTLLTAFSLLSLTVAITIPTPACAQSLSLYSASNMIPTNAIVGENNEPAINPVLPVIEMTNVPLSQGIRRLLRQSRMDFVIDPQVEEWWTMTDPSGHRVHEPMLNFRWTNITATAALYRVLKEHHMTVNEEPVTLISRITYSGDFFASKNLGSFAYGSNTVPLIQFENVPIRLVLKNLARAANLNYMLDPETRYGEFDWNGEKITEPRITLKLTNSTSEQVFCAICVTHQFVLIRDPRTTVILVRYLGHDVDFVKPDFYAHDTNIIPVIEFEKVPLSVALKNLARQTAIKCIISPRIDTGDPDDEVDVNVRWQNITGFQALAALCESYDLDVIKYPVSGIYRIEPIE